jgi:hypothetical protein
MFINEKRKESIENFRCNQNAGVTLDFIKEIDTRLPDGVSYDYPGLRFNGDATVEIPRNDLFPDQLPIEFSIMASVKPDSTEGGFLFALTDDRADSIFFGVEIGPDEEFASKMFISLYMNEIPYKREKIASFQVPRFDQRLTKFAIQVNNDEIFLYFNCDKIEDQIVLRALPPKALDISKSTKVHVGGTDSEYNDDETFKGMMQILQVSINEGAAKSFCDDNVAARAKVEMSDDEDLTDASGSGDYEDYTTEAVTYTPTPTEEVETETEAFTKQPKTNAVKTTTTTTSKPTTTQKPTTTTKKTTTTTEQVTTTTAPVLTPSPTMIVPSIRPVTTTTAEPVTVKIVGPPGQQGEPGEFTC